MNWQIIFIESEAYVNSESQITTKGSKCTAATKVEESWVASNRSQVASNPFECYRQRKVTFTAHKTYLNFNIVEELKARASKRRIAKYY